MDTGLIEPLTQFGVAGLMGVLWLVERWHSRRREQQLNEAHERLMREREVLSTLIALVQRNTQAIERFEQTQVRLQELLERMHRDIRKQAA